MGAVFLTFPSEREVENLDSKISKLIQYALFLSCLYPYFFSGLWKLKACLLNGYFGDINYASNIEAYYLLTHNKKSILADYIINRPIISYIGHMAVMTFQITSPISIFNKRYFKVFPILILIFHFLSILLLNINYFITGLVLYFVYSLVPMPSWSITTSDFFYTKIKPRK